MVIDWSFKMYFEVFYLVILFELIKCLNKFKGSGNTMCSVQQVKKMAELYLHGIISYNADCWISAKVLNVLGLGFATQQQANLSVLKMKA